MLNITSEYLSQNLKILHTDPEKFRALAEELIRSSPREHHGYYYRHKAWCQLGKKDLALADIDQVLNLKQHWVLYEAKGNVLRDLGRYQEAIESYNQAQAMDPERWSGGFGRLFRAECYARLGNETAALADCEHLRDEHWTPGLLGAPRGNKEEVTAELRSLAAEARASSKP